MASGMKYWLGTVFLGMALVSIKMLPLGSHEPPKAPPVLRPERDRFLALAVQIRQEGENIQRLDWLDRLTAMIEASGNEPTVLVELPTSVPAQVAEDFERGVRTQAAALGEPRATFGAFIIEAPEPTSLTDPGLRDYHEFYAGEIGGTPYCVAIHVVGQRQGSGSSLTSWLNGRVNGQPITGACAFFVRYGLPGDGVSRWLREGSFARGAWQRLSPGDMRYVGVDPEGNSSGLERMFGGDHRFMSLAGHGCIDGDLELCNSIFQRMKNSDNPRLRGLRETFPEMWANRDADGFGNHLGVIEPIMLADLEREFGLERFERFWSSDQEVAAAFESAFGIAPANWIQRWARGYMEMNRRPLMAGGGDWAATALALVVAFLYVLRTTQRRSVGG